MGRRIGWLALATTALPALCAAQGQEPAPGQPPRPAPDPAPAAEPVAPPSDAELREAVKRLEAKVAELEGRVDRAGPDPDEIEGEYPPRSAERPSARIAIGFGEGVTIATPSDDFSITVRARIQARFQQLQEDDGDSQTTFQVRRARLLFAGHAFSKEVSYYIQLGFSNGDTESDLRLVLRDAHMTWHAHRDANIRLGQMKVPFNRQRVTSSSALQMVDRSIVQSELNLDRDVGLTLYSKDLLGLGKTLGYTLGVFGGDGRNRVSSDSGVMVVGRLELSPFGGWNDEDEPDLQRRETPGLTFGLAAALNMRSHRTRSTHEGTFANNGQLDQAHACADVALKWQGLSLRAEGLWRDVEEDVLIQRVGTTNTFAAETTRSAWGFFGQGGYMLTDELEVILRHGELRPRGTTLVALQRETGLGLSYYVHDHALKVQADYFYLWRASIHDADQQVRLQVQVYF